MPTVHGLEFAYSLYPLPPGRMPFRRWRWELWHGSALIAAGWRLGRADAGRALRVHAAEHGHTLFGLPAPPRDPRVRPRRPRPGHDRAARDRVRSPRCSSRARSSARAVSAPVL